MTDQQPHTPEPCDHHWKSYLQPKNVGLSWIRQCSQCGDFDTDNLREQVDAAEQRGAEQAFRKIQEIIAGFEHTIDEARNRDDMINTGYLIQEIDTEIQDLEKADDETH